MKLTICFKTPDAVSYAIDSLLPDAEIRQSMSEEESLEMEASIYKMERFISKFVEFGESVSIEFDSEKETATVVRINK